MKIFLPNLGKLSKNQVATKRPGLSRASDMFKAAMLATLVELAAAGSLLVL
jgi:hypothetical protein